MSRNGGDSSTSEVVDVHGFTFHCSPDQQQDRKLCAQRQKAQTAAWEKYVKRKTLPKEDKLKKLCRKVGIALPKYPVKQALHTCPDIHAKGFIPPMEGGQTASMASARYFTLYATPALIAASKRSDSTTQV